MLRIRFQGGPQAGQVLEFGDDQERIVIGRDPARCTVQLPGDDTRVGREHCELRRELGRYSLVVNGDNPVWVNGQPVAGSQKLALDRENEVRLGTGGPILLVTPSLVGASGAAVLPPTAMHERSAAGVNTQLRRSLSSSRRSLIAACAALVIGALGIGAGALWYDKLDVVVDDTQQQVKQTQQQVAATQQQIAVSVEAIKGLGDLTVGQKSAIETLTGRLTDLSSSVEKLSPELADATRRAMASVYLVSVLTPDGKLRPCGTAWVCDQKRGLLATNAHVARIHKRVKEEYPEWKELPDDCPLAVSSPGEKSQVFEVADVTVHPGFDAFDVLWSRYDPARAEGKDRISFITEAGPACDVALLHVKNPKGLAPALELADDATLAALQSAAPLGFAGYPMENLSLGGVLVEEPTPQAQFGYITSVTDYFGIADPSSERLLIQHSVPTVGGASGSPLLNSHGEVVALHNASNLAGTLNDVRINSSSNIHYGQRVSLLRELLAGVADETQAKRSAAWEKRIAKYYVPTREVESGWAVESYKNKVIDIASRQGEFAIDVAKLALPPLKQTKAGDAGKFATFETSYEVQEPGVFLAAVKGQSTAIPALDLEAGSKIVHGDVPNKDDPACAGVIFVDEAGTLKITVYAPADDPLELEVGLLSGHRQSVDRLHQLLVERWAERWSKDPTQPKIERVREVVGKLAPVTVDNKDISANHFRFDPQAAGEYLVTLVADDSSAMQLIVDGASPGDDIAGKEASFLSVPISRTEPNPITGMMGSKVEHLGFSLRLYRAIGAKPAEPKAPAAPE